jgi:pimeloyl-ACP methyl ester carboxylesterase
VDLAVQAHGVTWTAVSGAFACRTARDRRVEIHGLELHLLEWGPAARSGILLLHGGAAHAHWFDAVGDALAERRHVVALDQRGHGASAWARPPDL